MELLLPYAGIVLLVGPSNSGKSTLLNQLMKKKQLLCSEIVSSDDFRKLVSDTEFIDLKQEYQDEKKSLYDKYQQISTEAFSLMYALVEGRCRLNKLTFVDATNIYPEDRKKYIAIARNNHVPIVAIILEVEQDILLSRDELRKDPRGQKKIKKQVQVFKRGKRFIRKEDYLETYFITDIDSINLVRQDKNPVSLDVEKGIDIIGDIHGCYNEMIHLLEKLGYQKNYENYYVHPEGRKFLSLGDIMSRGPKSLETIQFFIRHVNNELAYMIDSNHGWKIARWLEGRSVTLNHGDEQVEREINQYREEYGEHKVKELKCQVKKLLLKAPSHYVLTTNDIPVLVCTHAGIKDEFIGKQSYAISDFCRYGENDGVDESGKPKRKDWTTHHKTGISIIWGHDPKPKPLIINNTINIDQGVVFGGELTAYRYPEKQFFSVKAEMDYSGGSNNPLLELGNRRLDPPNIAKFINGYSVLTEHDREIQVPKKHIIPAIDLVSHVTVPIEELIYIPPTMCPTPLPSSQENYLEHPREAIEYYRSKGIERMIAQKKHMGSRGVLFLFKDKESALKYIGRKTPGIIYTRTGRKFFNGEQEDKIVSIINKNLTDMDYFNKYNTEFVLLDAEIMPWNLKAKELINSQYAHVSEMAILDRNFIINILKNTTFNNKLLENWLGEYESKLKNALTFRDVFQKYCWDVEDINQIKIAPFHVLAHSNETFFNKPHTWHMDMNRKFREALDIFMETEFMVIDNPSSEEKVVEWWEAITNDSHEGIVIKPEFFVTRAGGKLIQPAIKVRGRKYLNIIYGMDYLLPENLSRLKKRNTSKKQKLALNEFALGVEGIRRFVNGESLERVHECVLGTLAMEVDPVDSRL